MYVCNTKEIIDTQNLKYFTNIVEVKRPAICDFCNHDADQCNLCSVDNWVQINKEKPAKDLNMFPSNFTYAPLEFEPNTICKRLIANTDDLKWVMYILTQTPQDICVCCVGTKCNVCNFNSPYSYNIFPDGFQMKFWKDSESALYRESFFSLLGPAEYYYKCECGQNAMPFSELCSDCRTIAEDKGKKAIIDSPISTGNPNNDLHRWLEEPIGNIAVGKARKNEV